MPFTTIDEVVVINLPRRRDRMNRMRQRVPRDWPFPALHVHPGVEAEPPPYWRSTAGAYGCQQAHLQVLRSAWQRSVPATLILEDDATFATGFADTWRGLIKCAPVGWHMLMLGGQHVGVPRPYSDTGWVRCIDTRRTHAYVIRLNAIPLLMRTWERASGHIDHVTKVFQGQANVYAPARWLCGQDGGWSDTTNKENPRERFWHLAT